MKETILCSRSEIKSSRQPRLHSQDLTANLVPQIRENDAALEESVWGVFRGSACRCCSPCHEREAKQASDVSFQAGPQERLPGQEAVSSSHTQAQILHAEVQCLPLIHWKVCF